MNKLLYRSSRVVYNAHTDQYEVYYRNWFFWRFDRCYTVSEYLNPTSAKELAIQRAQGLLNTVEVWRQSNITY